MATDIDEENDGRRLLVRGELTIYGVAQVKDALWCSLSHWSEVEVDLSSVDAFDTAGLQLMLMSKRWPKRSVTYINHSPPVIRLIELSNVVLGDPLILSEQH